MSAGLLVLTLAIPQLTFAQGQVTPSELNQAIQNAAHTRQQNIDQVRGFFSNDSVRSALKAAKIDQNRLAKAVSTLSSDDLARLSSQTSAIQSDFAAGSLSNQDLTYIVIALAAAVLVLVVVAA
jgi:hypothetical protein